MSSGSNYPSTNPLANVTVLGLPRSTISSLSFDGAILAEESWHFDSETKVLTVTGLKNVTSAEQGGAWAKNWTLVWS